MMNKNNELMNMENSGFLALQDFNLSEVMSEEMDGLSATFERVKIPSGGGVMLIDLQYKCNTKKNDT